MKAIAYLEHRGDTSVRKVRTGPGVHRQAREGPAPRSGRFITGGVVPQGS